MIPATIASMTLAIAMQFLYAPTEATQGEVQRLYYMHVPSAWAGYLGVLVAAWASLKIVRRRDEWRRWDAWLVAGAEVAAVFLAIVLLTGPVWGKSAWGRDWPLSHFFQDARLTSTLVLWLILAGLLAFRALSAPGERRARLSAVIALVAVADIPIVHFSVNWWRTLHPEAAALRPQGPALPGSMLATLLVSTTAIFLLFATFLRVRASIERARIRLAHA